jgi:hypothetical protein
MTSFIFEIINRKFYYLKFFLVVFSFGFLFFFAFSVLSVGEDWRDAFRPAMIELINGRNPYLVKGFLMPPWVLLLLLPLVVLLVKIGYLVLMFASMICFFFISPNAQVLPCG